MSKIIVSAVLLVMLSVAGPSAHSMERWPKVEEVHKKYNFYDVDKAGFDLNLNEYGNDQKPLYILKCHSAAYEADKDFNYSGVIDCRLVSLYSKETVSSLLTENAQQVADWSDRARFLQAHLRKGCAIYPDWGQRRRFRLRGMDIVIAIANIVLDSTRPGERRIQSYSFDVAVKDDPTASTALAEKTPTPEPKWFYHPAEACVP